MYSRSKGGSLRITTASKDASLWIASSLCVYQSVSSAATSMRVDFATTEPPDNARLCCSQANTAWPRGAASRIMVTVESL